MFRISKHETFDAAHFLPNHLGKCKRMHGHTYRVTLIVEARALVHRGAESGMVCDYDQLGEALRSVKGDLDHVLLNEVSGLENPTTEVLAAWIFAEAKKKCPKLSAVRVEESATTSCEYRP